MCTNLTISGSKKGAVICSEVNASRLTSSFANFISIRIICQGQTMYIKKAYLNHYLGEYVHQTVNPHSLGSGIGVFFPASLELVYSPILQCSTSQLLAF